MAAKFSVNRKACRFHKPSPLGGKVLNEVKRMRGDLVTDSFRQALTGLPKRRRGQAS